MPVVPQNENARGSVDRLLGGTDSLGQTALAVDECRHQFDGVDLAAGLGVEMPAGLAEVAVDQLVGIVDHPDDRNGIRAVLRIDEQRLRVVIADDADGRGTFHFLKHVLKLGAERGILNVVDRPLQTGFPVIRRHSCATGAEVGMVIGSEKYVGDGILFANSAEKSAHRLLLSNGKGVCFG